MPQDPYGTKVPRLDMCRSILSIAERNVGVGIGGDREVDGGEGGVDKI